MPERLETMSATARKGVKKHRNDLLAQRPSKTIVDKYRREDDLSRSPSYHLQCSNGITQFRLVKIATQQTIRKVPKFDTT